MSSSGQKRLRRRSALKAVDAEPMDVATKKRVSFSRNIAEVRNFRNNLSTSLRSQEGFDTSGILKELGAVEGTPTTDVNIGDQTVLSYPAFDVTINLNQIADNTAIFAEQLKSSSTPSIKRHQRRSNATRNEKKAPVTRHQAERDMDLTRAHAADNTLSHMPVETTLGLKGRTARRTQMSDMDMTYLVGQPARSGHAVSVMEIPHDDGITDQSPQQDMVSSASASNKRGKRSHNAPTTSHIEIPQSPTRSNITRSPTKSNVSRSPTWSNVSRSPRKSNVSRSPQKSNVSRSSTSFSTSGKGSDAMSAKHDRAESSLVQSNTSGRKTAKAEEEVSTTELRQCTVTLDVMGEEMSMMSSMQETTQAIQQITPKSHTGSQLIVDPATTQSPITTTQSPITTTQPPATTTQSSVTGIQPCDLEYAEKKILQLTEELATLQKVKELKIKLEEAKRRSAVAKKAKDAAHRKFKTMERRERQMRGTIAEGLKGSVESVEAFTKLALMQKMVAWSWIPQEDIKHHVFTFPVGTTTTLAQLGLNVILDSLADMNIVSASVKLTDVQPLTVYQRYTLKGMLGRADAHCTRLVGSGTVDSLLSVLTKLTNSTNDFLLELETITQQGVGFFEFPPGDTKVEYRVQKGCDWVCYYVIKGLDISSYPTSRLEFSFRADDVYSDVPDRMRDVCKKLHKLNPGAEYLTRCCTIIHETLAM